MANYGDIQTNIRLTTPYSNCTYNNIYNDFKNTAELLEGVGGIQ